MLKMRDAAENINPRIASRSNKTINPTLTVCLITFGVPSGGAPSANNWKLAIAIFNKIIILRYRLTV